MKFNQDPLEQVIHLKYLCFFLAVLYLTITVRSLILSIQCKDKNIVVLEIWKFSHIVALIHNAYTS